MRFTWKATAATVLVAAIVVAYVGFLVWGSVPFIQGVSGMAAAGLVLGLVATLFAGYAAFDPGPLHRTALTTGVLALVLGGAAAWTGYEFLLAAFVVAIVVTWALGIVIHTEVLPAARREGHVHAHI